MQKSFDEKLQKILANPNCNEFIIADAKDGDMGFGIPAPGPNFAKDRHRYKTIEQYRQAMRDLVNEGDVDIMLMSASTSEQLTIKERLFEGTAVTPAVRANDTTDIWCGLSGDYSGQPSLPFRTATIDHIQTGKYPGNPDEPHIGANLGLYSITFMNDAELDRRSLSAYREFRLEAEQKQFRHFLEVFIPESFGDRTPNDVPSFVNDCIARCLGGVTESARPLFLKIPYMGAEAMQALCRYDPTVVVGILGGSSGTTCDAFHLLAEAKSNGARVSLFGRRINNADHQLSFVKWLRAVADGKEAPASAVEKYHADLESFEIKPQRPLEEDIKLTQFD
ncbi:MAG: hypothetical protein CMJ78_22180 [Planctomycetaceae bacterium]|nr:hypothetical protein [Planctomycetaceae bacterium]